MHAMESVARNMELDVSGIEVIGKAIFRRKYQREYCGRYIITILNNVWAQFGKCLLSDQCN
jgi:hypothetical protein